MDRFLSSLSEQLKNRSSSVCLTFQIISDSNKTPHENVHRNCSHRCCEFKSLCGVQLTVKVLTTLCRTWAQTFLSTLPNFVCRVLKCIRVCACEVRSLGLHWTSICVFVSYETPVRPLTRLQSKFPRCVSSEWTRDMTYRKRLNQLLNNQLS